MNITMVTSKVIMIAGLFDEFNSKGIFVNFALIGLYRGVNDQYEL